MVSLILLALLFFLVHASPEILYQSIDWNQRVRFEPTFAVYVTQKLCFRASSFNSSVIERYSSFALDIGDVYDIIGSDLMQRQKRGGVLSVNLVEDWFLVFFGQFYDLDDTVLDLIYFRTVGPTFPFGMMNSESIYPDAVAGIKFSTTSYSQSPTAATMPIVTVPVDQVFSFQIPVIRSSENAILLFALISDDSDDFSLDERTGVMTWNTKVTGKRAVQVAIGEVDSEVEWSEARESDEPKIRSSYLYFTVDVVDTSMERCKAFCDNVGAPCGAVECSGCTPPPLFQHVPVCALNAPPFLSSVKMNGENVSTVETLDINVGRNPSFEIDLLFSDPNPEDSIQVFHSSLPQAVTIEQSDSERGRVTLTIEANASNLRSISCFSAIDSHRNAMHGQFCIRFLAPKSTIADLSGDGVYSTTVGHSKQIYFKSTSSNPKVSIRPGFEPIDAQPTGDGFVAEYDALEVGNFLIEIYEQETNAVLSLPLKVTPNPLRKEKFQLSDYFSTGTKGGIQGSTVYFYAQLVDEYSNIIKEDRSPEMWLHDGTDRLLSEITYIGDGFHRVVYTVPLKSTYDLFLKPYSGSSENYFGLKGISEFETFNATLEVNNLVTPTQSLDFTITIHGLENASSLEWMLWLRFDENPKSPSEFVNFKTFASLSQAVPYIGGNQYKVSLSWVHFAVGDSFEIRAFAVGNGNGDFENETLSNSTRYLSQVVSIWDNKLGISALEEYVPMANSRKFETYFYLDNVTFTNFPNMFNVTYSVFDSEENQIDSGPLLRLEDDQALFFSTELNGTGRYRYEIETDSGEDSILVKFNRERFFVYSPWAASPITSTISKIKSKVTPNREYSVVLSLFDANGNPRPPASDQIQISTTKNGQTKIIDSTVIADRFSNKYYVFYNLKERGQFNFAISVRVFSIAGDSDEMESTYISFAEVSMVGLPAEDLPVGIIAGAIAGGLVVLSAVAFAAFRYFRVPHTTTKPVEGEQENQFHPDVELFQASTLKEPVTGEP